MRGELFFTGRQAAVEHGPFALGPVSHFTRDACVESYTTYPHLNLREVMLVVSVPALAHEGISVAWVASSLSKFDGISIQDIEV